MWVMCAFLSAISTVAISLARATHTYERGSSISINRLSVDGFSCYGSFHMHFHFIIRFIHSTQIPIFFLFSLYTPHTSLRTRFSSPITAATHRRIIPKADGHLPETETVSRMQLLVSILLPCECEHDASHFRKLIRPLQWLTQLINENQLLFDRLLPLL